MTGLSSEVLLRGSYQNIRNFLHELEVSPEFILIDNLSLNIEEEKYFGCKTSIINIFFNFRLKQSHKARINLKLSRSTKMLSRSREKSNYLLGFEKHHSDSGFSFIELLMVTAILAILASAVMPLSQVTIKTPTRG